MSAYEKRGYLNQDFRIFHPKDTVNREFSYHYHDFYKILIFLRGDVTYCIEGKSYELSPYDIVLINTGEIHRPIIQSTKIYERIILYISPDFLRSCAPDTDSLELCFQHTRQQHSNVLRIPSIKNSRLFRTLKEMEQTLQNDDYGNELLLNALFLEFMVHLNRAAVHNTLSFIPTLEANDKILSVLSYINEHLTENISIDFLAETFFTSKYYLMHAFKKETGYTIGNYLNIKRLRYAKELIQSGSPVSQACFECGFRNYSTFSRAYKKQFGSSPTGN